MQQEGKPLNFIKVTEAFSQSRLLLLSEPNTGRVWPCYEWTLVCVRCWAGVFRVSFPFITTPQCTVISMSQVSTRGLNGCAQLRGPPTTLGRYTCAQWVLCSLPPGITIIMMRLHFAHLNPSFPQGLSRGRRRVASPRGWVQLAFEELSMIVSHF